MKKKESSMEQTISKTVDCVSENCPMPLINTRKAIMGSEKGDVIKVIGTHPQSFEEIPMALDALGHEILERGHEENHWYIVFVVS
jgi:TusA-related sulfurtransferase